MWHPRSTSSTWLSCKIPLSPILLHIPQGYVPLTEVIFTPIQAMVQPSRGPHKTVEHLPATPDFQQGDLKPQALPRHSVRPWHGCHLGLHPPDPACHRVGSSAGRVLVLAVFLRLFYPGAR